ncbi:activin receptor type-2B isoform X1 [Rhopalosiphum maidis]|uniref:activin receptor type-2B isoform X1 n=1 Tax=Rhopalosiphum maidis TaxID=43146 RepID=UPI000EFE30DC|nr:activin receptor type-2B isoform X1 [Rhopalosiphum maidis]XP_026823461.1 activin receptor type-2B isoform X1 [Rhopalosiphum maidis]
MEQKLWIWICSVLFLVTICNSASRKKYDETKCHYYNQTICDNSQNEKSCTSAIQNCKAGENDKPSYCYAVWTNDTKTNKLEIKLKGCFLNNVECQGQNQCKDKKEEIKPNGLMFCCCEGDYCNSEILWDPIPTTPRIETTSAKPLRDDNELIHTIVFSTIPLVAVASMFLFVYWVYKRRKIPQFSHWVPSSDSSHLGNCSPILSNRPIQLVEVKARGRYGAVWKALHKKDTVAVKIFPPQDKNSWLVEQDIYQLPHMQHDNMLSFIGAEKHASVIEGAKNEYWLITAYHDYGSLCDYLKSNILTWDQLCHIAQSMARGLMHLHEEIPSERSDQYKPAIAHRDFKSNNVLLKHDLTACIADFGLALVFQPGKSCGDTHGQVGTRRYMAPEVLEGAINFSRDAFLRIDMYACGLVLWELATRCTAQQGPIPDYRLPFEEEVGQHPSLEDMQECVVHKKLRPAFKDSWKSHPGLIALCDTMEECWDHDAEARLSASCVMERITWQCRQYNGTTVTTLAP